MLFKYFFIIILLSVQLISFAQVKPVNSKFQTKGKYINYKYISPISGKITRIKKKTGKWKYWYSNGTLMKIENYKNEKKGVIKKNIPVGTWSYWDENGKLFKERIFEYEKPVMEKLYTDGVQTGKKIYKYKEEALAKIEEYSDSLLIKEKIYNEAGKLLNVISYTNGNLTKKLIYKYLHGKLKKIETYNKDILTKESLYNYNVLSEEKLYDNGKLTRELIYAYNGLFREKIYENDLLIKEKGDFDFYNNANKIIIYKYENKNITDVETYLTGKLKEHIIYEYSGEQLSKVKKYLDYILVNEIIYKEGKKHIEKIYNKNKLTNETIRYNDKDYFTGWLIKEKTYNDSIICNETYYQTSDLIINKIFNEGEIFKELTYKNDNLIKEKIYIDTLHIKERYFSNNSLTKESLYKGNILIKDDIYKNGKLIKTKKFLIPNSGFEIYNKLPYFIGIGDECIFAWSNPNDGTPDYFHYDSPNPFTRVPKNKFGLQQAHSGNAYAGLFSEINWKEYLQTKLISPLVKDVEYKINLFLCRGEIFTNDTINEIGIFFTENQFRQAGAKKLNITPQIIFDDKETYINAHTWVPMSAIYKAKGNENYITIGFANDNYKITYYYIDDISIEKVSPDASGSDNGLDGVEEYFGDPKTGKSFVLKNIYFNFDKSVLLPASYNELNKLYKLMNKNSSVKIEIAGHTDYEGTEEHNKQLSGTRAKAVADYLTGKGISKDRIKYKGYGSSKPIADNSTKKGRSLNRRVEVIFIE